MKSESQQLRTLKMRGDVAVLISSMTLFLKHRFWPAKSNCLQLCGVSLQGQRDCSPKQNGSEASRRQKREMCLRAILLVLCEKWLKHLGFFFFFSSCLQTYCMCFLGVFSDVTHSIIRTLSLEEGFTSNN